MPGTPFTVSGEIAISATTPSFSGARATVRLEDVSRLDAPARLIAQQVIERVTHHAGRPSGLSFELRAPAADRGAQYNVRVHIDLDGDGQVSGGDLITTESYPVADARPPGRLTIRLQQIGR